MLLQSLDVADQPTLWLSTLNTVYDLLHDAKDAFTSHIGDFIPRLSVLIRFKPDMVINSSRDWLLHICRNLDYHYMYLTR